MQYCKPDKDKEADETKKNALPFDSRYQILLMAYQRKCKTEQNEAHASQDSLRKFFVVLAAHQYQKVKQIFPREC